MNIELDTIHCMDAIELCDHLPAASVDMILADLPYGITASEWDSVIPLEPMWAAFKRVISTRGVIVITGSQPFTSKLIVSNIDWFRCEWIWKKPQGTNYPNANRQPMKNHENIIVFSKHEHKYYPQMRKGEPYRATRGAVGGSIRDKTLGGCVTINSGYRFPLSVVSFNAERGLHPTQKPVALFEYLIKTYTQPGDVVLDPVCGSGTTAVAARKTGRHFICGDNSQEYVALARKRLQDTDPYQDTEFSNGHKQLSLFEGRA